MIKNEGIILSRTPHGTDGIILNILSPEGLHGGIYNGLSKKKTSVHAGETQVGSLVEYVTYHSTHSQNLSRIREVNQHPAHPVNTPLSPFRMAQKMFMCDITRCTIRGTVSDAPLYDLLCEHLSSLSTSRQTFACMLYAYRLCAVLGFEPQETENFSGQYFDMCEGVFSPAKPPHKYYLTPLNSSLFFSLNTCDEEKPQFSSVEEWEKTWHILMTYYSLHVSDFLPPRSLEYLKEITRMEFFPLR